MLKFIIVTNRQGLICLAKYFESMDQKDKDHVQAEMMKRCLTRSEQQCSFVEYRNYKLVYQRHGALCTIVAVDDCENELAVLELVDCFIKILNKCFDRVNDEVILQNLEYVYMIIDEMVCNGQVVETNQAKIVGAVKLYNHTIS